MSKIKVNEISKHDASEITVNDTVKVDTIEEKTSGAGVTVDGLTIKDTGFNEPVKIKNYTTTQVNALSGMGAGDMVYDSDLGTLKVYNGSSWNAMSANTFNFTVEYLFIAGGGGAGSTANNSTRGPGGGGAGGLLTASDLTLATGTAYTVSLGAGGAGGTAGGFNNGVQGSASTMVSGASTLISATGGGFGSAQSNSAGDGGSGGGAGYLGKKT